MKLAGAALAAVLAFGSPALAQQQRALDMRLVDAGFKMRPALTPEQVAHLRRLPARKFVPRMTGNQRYYIYVDPDDCKCAFVGSEIALKAYRDMLAPPPQPSASLSRGMMPADDLIIHEMNDDLPNIDLFNHPF